MAEIRRTHILELREGAGTPDSIPLEAGGEMGPMSVGTDGDWRLRGDGIREIHAFLYFDGERLFVQSADRREPVKLDRVAVGESWTEAHAPCTIGVGAASIVYRSLTDAFDDTTDVDEKPAGPRLARPVTVRPFAPGAFSRGADEESTRLQPLAAGPKGARVAPLPAAGRPAPERPPPSGDATRVDRKIVERTLTNVSPPSDDHPTRINVPAFDPRKPQPITPPRAPASVAPPPVAAPPPPPPPEPPPPLPAVMIAPRMTPTAPAAPAIGGTGSRAPAPIDVPPAAAAPKTPAPGGIGAAWRSASAPKKILVLLLPLALASVFVIFRDEPVPRPPSLRPSASIPTPAPSTPIAPSASNPPSAPAPSIAPIPSGTASAADGAVAAADAGKSALERAAVDAVAAGAYAEAIRLYDQLAASNPEKPVYREAARILRSRLDSGAVP